MASEAAKCRAALKQALKLLREAKGAIDDELNASGQDEVNGNPILKGHDRTSDKIERFLLKHP